MMNVIATSSYRTPRNDKGVKWAIGYGQLGDGVVDGTDVGVRLRLAGSYDGR